MEYNKLTIQLLNEGYDAEHYPDYVNLSNSGVKKSLDNIYGGFTYKWYYVEKLVYQTPCGKFVLGENVLSDVSYMGVEWSHENDCPLLFCPLKNMECGLRDPLLKDFAVGGRPTCACHRTEAPYDYENSIEKILKEKDRKMREAREQFIEDRNGHACVHHMYYNEDTETWRMEYDPMECAKHGCNGFCPLRGRELSNKRGNVYVDKKYTHIRNDGTIFDGEVSTEIIKDVRFLKSPVSMDICEEVVSKCRDRILRYYNTNSVLGPTSKLEIMNIRAACRPSRDLMQDLEDIRAGIAICHESDLVAKDKADKRAHREALLVKKKKALAKKLVTTGLSNIPPHSTDHAHAHKWFTPEELDEFEEQRLKKQQDNSYYQITLFDTITMNGGDLHENI